MAWLGIDLGGTNTSLGLVGEDGLWETRRLATRAAEGPEAWLDRLAPLARELGEAAARRGSPLAGVGLASPGSLDREAGRVVFSPNLPSFNGYPLGSELSAALDLPVALENDANLYALGERTFGAGQSRDDLACLTLGTGVGAGIILGGHLVVGPLGSGGELGHMVVEPAGRTCGCGVAGCLEAYASATGLKGMLAEALQQGRETTLGPGDDPHQMHQAAQAGDALARELWARAGRALGRAVAALVVTCGLDLVIIGGGLAAAWPDFLAPAAREELARRLRIVEPERVKLVPGVLGDQAPLLGAAGLAAHGR
ncbi:MAG: ROK family protein [Deltaproteobacteria bacterium]|nr:ROK family protein [Deltaproteobacteria bacterium]